MGLLLDRATWHTSYQNMYPSVTWAHTSTCWPCGLILPLKSEVIALSETPIVTFVEWMNRDLWKGLPIELVTTHSGWGLVMVSPP